MYYFLNVAASQIVGLKVIACHIGQSSFVGFNHSADNSGCWHFTYAHQHQLYQRYMDSAYTGGNPEKERYIVKEYADYCKGCHSQNDGGEFNRIHGVM